MVECRLSKTMEKKKGSVATKKGKLKITILIYNNVYRIIYIYSRGNKLISKQLNFRIINNNVTEHGGQSVYKATINDIMKY